MAPRTPTISLAWVSSPQSRPARFPGWNLPWRPSERRHFRENCFGGRTQECEGAGRHATCVGTDRPHRKVHRTSKETAARRGVRSVGVRVEGRVREGVDGGRRALSKLRIDFERPPVRDPPADVHRLQQHVAQLQAQLHQQIISPTTTPQMSGSQGDWLGDEGASSKIPPMPSRAQDLHGWMSHRNQDMRNASEVGDEKAITQVGRLLASGSALSVQTNSDARMDAPPCSRSAMMSSLIEDGDANRRCLALLCSVQNQVR